MKVIMLKDVAGVGQRGQIKEVADGFALNSLIPKRAAELATPEKIAIHTRQQIMQKAEHEARDKQWKAQAAKAEGARILLKENANTQGHLYERIHRKEVSKALADNGFGTIDPEHVHMKMAIKQTGEWPIEVSFGSHRATVIVEVTAK